MKKFYLALLFLPFLAWSQSKSIVLSKQTLQDKIKGGWAGQTIGVTFGGPMEFRYNGTMIDAYQPVPWYDGYLKKTMLENLLGQDVALSQMPAQVLKKIADANLCTDQSL